MRGNVQALFGGEGLVFLGNQDPASYPTFFVSFALTGPMQRMHPLFHILRHFCRDFYGSGPAFVSISPAISSNLAGVIDAVDPIYFLTSCPPICR